MHHQVSDDGQVLNLVQVGAHSSGIYGCAAKNSLGTRHKLFNMTVLSELFFVQLSIMFKIHMNNITILPLNLILSTGQYGYYQEAIA